jgi:hypothetical protein
MVEHGRHREASEIVLATIPNANAVLAQALRGIADAWDKCELGIYNGLAVRRMRRRNSRKMGAMPAMLGVLHAPLEHGYRR